MPLPNVMRPPPPSMGCSNLNNNLNNNINNTNTLIINNLPIVSASFGLNDDTRASLVSVDLF